MGLRDEFERLGVADHLLAQVIWAELDDTTYSAKELVGLAQRLFPDGVHEQVAAVLQPAIEPPRIDELRDWLVRARRFA